MNFSESTDDNQSGNSVVPSLKRSLIIGGIGFCLVSSCVFATVAFAEVWMYRRFGLVGAYLVWTVLFILLGGGALSVLVTTTMRLPVFYLLFALAFFAYAVGWTGMYFNMGGGKVGEWLGSFVGSVLMGIVFAIGFRVLRSSIMFSAFLFISNSVGYFLGLIIYDSVRGKSGMILWGSIYGLCLGAGLGAVLHFAQTHKLNN